MYCTYYGFREKPFNITPNPRFIYLSKNHKEAFAHLLYGINGHAGFIELTGEVGTGKTTVLRTILEQLDDSTHKTALILNPCLSSLELLRNINREFGIPHDGLENGALLDELNRFLLAENREGRTVVLVIDEAQNLTPQVLEQIRLISNLETESDKLIQIVLAGQPELKKLLEKPELRQLSQRITVRYHLLPMDFDDSCTYIRHRLSVAGGRENVTFSPSALRRVYTFAKGSPRLINIACDRSLLIGYTEEKRELTGNMASMAIRELVGSDNILTSRKIRLFQILGGALLILIISLAIPRDPAEKGTMARSISADEPLATKRPPSPGEVARQVYPEPEEWLKLPQSYYPAVNAILGLWGGAVAVPDRKSRSISAIARNNGFSTTQFSSIDTLRKLDIPVIMEISTDKGKNARLVAVTAIDQDQVMYKPELSGAATISLKKLTEIWTGRGRILWKNFLAIPSDLQPGAEGNDVVNLQHLLNTASFLKESPTGLFDETTSNAVKAFQRANGLTADGRPGEWTLLLLYRNNPTFNVPRLTSRTGKHS